MDSGMLLLIVFICLGIAVLSSHTLRKEKPREKGSAELKIRRTGDEPVTHEDAEKKPKVVRKKTQQSLDELYAEENRLWICCRCETLNEDSNDCCAACGAKR